MDSNVRLADVQVVTPGELERAAKHPEPPYKEGDAASPETPAMCYYQGCSYQAKSWGLMLKHVTNPLASKGHGRQWKSLKGTPLHSMGSKELNAKAAGYKRKRVHDKATANAAGTATPQPEEEATAAATTEATLPTGAPVDVQEGELLADHSTPPHQAAPCASPINLPPAGDGFTWQPKMCFVKCTHDGAPALPLEVACLCPDVVKADPPHDEAAAQHVVPQAAPGAARMDGLAMAPHTSGADADQRCDQLAQHEQPAKSTPAGSNDLLLEVHSMLQTVKAKLSPDKAAWLKALPTVAIKGKYLDSAHAPTKTLRTNWPKACKQDSVVLEGFRQYLKNELGNDGAHFKSMYNGVSRILGALECVGPQGESKPSESMATPECLVAMYTTGAVNDVLGMPLLDPSYTWSLKALQGMVHYCTYQSKALTDMVLKCEEGPWREYLDVIRQLSLKFQGSHLTKCQKQLQASYQTKHKEDMAALKRFPPWEMLQARVKESFLLVKLLGRKYGGANSMPPALRAVANTHTVGSSSYNSYIGRKMEWELLELLYMRGVLASEESHITCTKHKTWWTYGDLAKHLTPGNKDLYKCYDTLPRRDDSTLFFQPARPGSVCVSFPSCLKQWNTLNVKDPSMAKPSHNLLRKKFHRELMRLTDSKEGLKKVMTIIDAHSKYVMDKHYCISDPEEDAKLAAHLVDTVIGKTVAWPTDEELDQALGKNDSLSKWLVTASAVNQPMSEEEGADDSDAEDEDAEEMEWWKNSAAFRVRGQGLLPLEAPPEVAPVADDVAQQADTLVLHPGCADNSPASSSAQQQHVRACDADAPKEGVNKKAKPLSAEKRALYEEYTISVPVHQKMMVDFAAKDWMVEQLLAWQHENGADPWEKPQSTEWYYDKRVEAIQRSHLTKYHSKDVVRSHITAFCKKKQDDAKKECFTTVQAKAATKDDVDELT